MQNRYIHRHSFFPIRHLRHFSGTLSDHPKPNNTLPAFEYLKSALLLIALMVVPGALFVYIPIGMDIVRQSKMENRVIAREQWISIKRLLAAETATKRPAEIYSSLLQNEFRVLVLEPGAREEQIFCRLIVCRTSDDLPYEALSYVWGSSTATKAIRCNGQDFAVTENLHDALLRLRHPRQARLLWVDAVCINQGNTTERGHQVKNMAKIFSAARRVIVWLGRGTDRTLMAISSLRKLQNQSSVLSELYPWLDVPFSDQSNVGRVEAWLKFGIKLGLETEAFVLPLSDQIALEALLELPYFTRVWVFQEVAKAKVATVMCGRNRFDWATLASAARDFVHSGLAAQLSEKAKAGAEAVMEMEKARKQVLKGDQRGLLSILLATSSAECSDPRDRVYGVLALAGDYNPDRDLEAFVPDYSIELPELFKRVARWSIGKGNLNILSYASRREDTGAAPAMILPSWVPDWTRIDNEHAFARYLWHLPFNAGGSDWFLSGIKDITRPILTNNDELILRGRTLDIVETVGVLSPLPRKSGNDGKGSHESIRAWLQECESLVSAAHREPENGRHLNDSWRTLTAGLTGQGNPAPDSFGAWFGEYKKLLYSHGTPLDDNAGLTRLDKGSAEIESSILMWPAHRRFAVLESNFVALVPERSQRGDCIVLLPGSKVPCVLRPGVGKDEYTVIGEAYFDHVMDGTFLWRLYFSEYWQVLRGKAEVSFGWERRAMQRIFKDKYIIR